MLRRILLTGALVISAGSAVLSPSASAQSYGGCAATVSDTTPSAGQTVTVTGSGAANGGAVTASVGGTQVGAGTASSTGTFSFPATVPAGASGAISLSVSCGGASVDVLSLTVAAVDLARTGSSTLPLTLVAFGALATGGAVLTAAGRRSQSPS